MVRPRRLVARGGIGLSLGALTLGTALPLAAGLLTIVLVSRDLVREHARRDLRSAAAATADGLGGYLSRIGDRLEEGANRPDVRAFAPSVCDGLGRGFLAALPQAVSLVLVGPGGRPVCSTGAGRAPTGDPAAIAAVMGRRTRAVGDPSTVGATAPYATLVSRVDGEAGRGALVLGLALGRLGTQLGSAVPGNDGSLGAITRSGTLITRLPAIAAAVPGRTYPAYRDLDRSGRLAEAEGIDGVRRIYTAVPVAGTDWVAVASISRREAFAIPDRIMRIGIGFGIAAVALAGALATVLGRSLRHRVRIVAAAAGRLGSLERGVRVPEAGPAELKEVARSFNVMAANLEGSHDELRRLREIDASIVTAPTVQEASSRVAVLLRQLTGADRVAVHLVEDAELVVLAADGLWQDRFPVGRRFPVEWYGPIAERWREGLPVHLRDIRADEHPRAAALDPPMGSSLHLPLLVDERLVGVVTLSLVSVGGLGAEAAARAAEVAGHLRIALDRSREAAARIGLTARLQTLLDLDRAILVSESPQEVAAVGVAALAAREQLVRVSVARYDVGKRTAELLAVSGAADVTAGVGARVKLADDLDLEALARGETVMLRDVRQAAGNAFYDRLAESGVHGVVCIPLVAQGELLGAMHLAPADGGSAVTDCVIESAREVADQLAIAMRQALLLERERGALAAMADTLAELAALQEVSDTSLARLPLPDLIERLLPRVCSLLDAGCSRLLLVDEDGDLRVAASHGLDVEVENRVSMPIGVGIAGRVAAERELRFFTADELGTAFSPALRERVRALVAAPLLSGDDVLGVLDVGRYDERPFVDADRRLLTVAVDRIAAAVERARREERLELAVAARTAELRHANDDLDAFAYSVSHDLRAPLRAMRGFSAALVEDYGPVLAEEGRHYAGRIVAAVARMEELIDDLLSYARLARTDLVPEPVDLDVVVVRALAALRPRPDVARAEIDVQPDLGSVLAHPSTLTTAVSNLVDNAVKYVEAGVIPRIRIRSERRGRTVRLWVEDDGIGIAPEHHDRVYRVFERLHGTEAYDGTGVGLASVRRGVERMRGATGVESAPGQGSRFWIDLPARRST